MLNQLGWLIYSCKSYMFVSFIHVNARTKVKLIKVIVKYLKMLPYERASRTLIISVINDNVDYCD